jgi:hypothetical protein
VVQDQEDPYAKAIQTLVEHTKDLEQTVATLGEKVRQLENELAGKPSDSVRPDSLRAVK